MKNSLCIHSISKSYRKGNVRANDNISTCFSAGEVVALTGHNGAGKTTFLNQIIGVTKPDSGSITYQGHSLVKETKVARSLISMMPQFHAPLAGVTLRQSVESVLRIKGVSGYENKQLADDIIQELQIEEWANKSGEKLSGGLQRLTSFAMAVVAPPPIILLDEPTNDVDPVRRKTIWRYLRKLAQKGHIIVVVTHNLLEVEQYTDRYLLMDRGKLIKDSPIREVNLGLPVSNLLTITVNSSLDLNDFPEVLDIVFNDEDMQYDFELTHKQVPDALDWVLRKINEKEVVNYRLAPSSINNLYGELTNEE
ncbi:ABC transporter ATP-binding protein [Lysinibacillus sp. fls2-241-R2A-57]|uniref:ABC transporter ATP-binding protein n=1 Tax=Lysinibacillus sp. fls2-241-R2A-57 TaxID=3040292 RepID=UPI002555F2E7|nr:ABC transporter ATP-binding protein [Lysinibacillus sp. fls2-241-R2A-57]